jgi:hypothetical protein
VEKQYFSGPLFLFEKSLLTENSYFVDLKTATVEASMNHIRILNSISISDEICLFSSWSFGNAAILFLFTPIKPIQFEVGSYMANSMSFFKSRGDYESFDGSEPQLDRWTDRQVTLMRVSP